MRDLILRSFGNLPPDSQPVSRYSDHHRQGNNPNKPAGRISRWNAHFSRVAGEVQRTSLEGRRRRPDIANSAVANPWL